MNKIIRLFIFLVLVISSITILSNKISAQWSHGQCGCQYDYNWCLPSGGCSGIWNACNIFYHPVGVCYGSLYNPSSECDYCLDGGCTCHYNGCLGEGEGYCDSQTPCCGGLNCVDGVHCCNNGEVYINGQGCRPPCQNFNEPCSSDSQCCSSPVLHCSPSYGVCKDYEFKCSPGRARDCGNCGTEYCNSQEQWSGSCVGDNPSAGQDCNCGPCGCGGKIQCNGACSGGNPTPSNYGQACGNGGTIQCNGQCSNPCDSRQGQACGTCGRGHYDCAGNCNGDYSNCGGIGWQSQGTSCNNCGTWYKYCNGCDLESGGHCFSEGPCSPGQVINGGGCGPGNCGTTKQDCQSNCQWGGVYCSGGNSGAGQPCMHCGGTIKCDYSCSVVDPYNYNWPCGSCGGTIGCDGVTCSIGTPPDINQPCNGNGCGQFGGTRKCDGSCSGAIPPLPTPCGCTAPPDVNQPCNSCGGTRKCDGSCTPAQPVDLGASCSACGTRKCDGSCTPAVPITYNQDCNCNSCNQCGGKIKCDGTCSGPKPSDTQCGICNPNPTPANYGQACNCNSCGQCGGTVGCNGCTGPTPPNPSGYGTSCNSCGGTKQCDGSCTPSQPADLGQSCSACGTRKCDGSCTPTVPSNYGQICNCRSDCPSQCGGTYKCDGTCSGAMPSSCNPCAPNPAPANYGQSCNSCGGTYQCDGSCKPAQRSDYGQSCDSFGSVIQCDGSCKGPCAPNPTPPNYQKACGAGNCGKIDCSGNCIVSSQCTSGQTQCLNNKYQTCPSCAWQNSGTNADGDSKDKECGDNLCDNSAGVYDSTRTATETNCADGLDNDCNGLTDCADPVCSGKGNCCTPINRDCKLMSRNHFEEMFRKCYRDHDRELCNKIAANIDVESGNYYGCPKNALDSACCQNPSSCVWNGVCYPDGYKKDFNGDGIVEICVAHSPGQWVPEWETDCTNGIDDDLDGLIDCADSDCDGILNGTVKNKENLQPISLADVSARQDLATIKTATTNQNGIYSMDLSCGDYSAVASHPDYAPQTRAGIFVPPRGQAFANISMVLGTSCEQDCTYASDNIVHASCDGKNGCKFYDSISKAACDLSQPGWIRNYNSTHYIVCASGSPQPKIEIQASLSCSSGTLVKITRIVLYNGKPVKLVVATCG